MNSEALHTFHRVSGIWTVKVPNFVGPGRVVSVRRQSGEIVSVKVVGFVKSVGHMRFARFEEV